MSIGFVFGAFGDYALAFESLGSFYFIFGLLFFLIGHVFNIAALWQPSPTKQSIALRLDFAIELGVLGAVVAYVFVTADSFDSKLTVPVIAYVAIISAGVWRAFARVGAAGELRTRQLLIATGLYMGFT